ncbi:thioesterase family protein [Conexibacter sp. SYSU D00693]|uniref:acyl-CoA thioesterase n=1 Tax=Conexibacter sp. SYSU D00693 TaxID=2812560 RepID=UPI00196B258E|nr:thioesterase family protein [Conexibacter sp. SYSU D00693]
MSFVHTLRVRYNECDPQGVVFNANYLTYADLATNELWRDELGGYDTFLHGGHDVVVAEANVHYLAAARFDDLLDVAITVDRIGTTSIVQRFTMTRDGTDVAEVVLRYVCVGRDGRPAPVPDVLRERLAVHLTDPAPAPS